MATNTDRNGEPVDPEPAASTTSGMVTELPNEQLSVVHLLCDITSNNYKEPPRIGECRRYVGQATYKWHAGEGLRHSTRDVKYEIGCRGDRERASVFHDAKKRNKNDYSGVKFRATCTSEFKLPQCLMQTPTDIIDRLCTQDTKNIAKPAWDLFDFSGMVYILGGWLSALSWWPELTLNELAGEMCWAVTDVTRSNQSGALNQTDIYISVECHINGNRDIYWCLVGAALATGAAVLGTRNQVDINHRILINSMKGSMLAYNINEAIRLLGGYYQLAESGYAFSYALYKGLHAFTSVVAHSDEGGFMRDLFRVGGFSPSRGGIPARVKPTGGIPMLDKWAEYRNICKQVDNLCLVSAALVAHCDPLTESTTDGPRPTIAVGNTQGFDLTKRPQLDEMLSTMPRIRVPDYNVLPTGESSSTPEGGLNTGSQMDSINEQDAMVEELATLQVEATPRPVNTSPRRRRGRSSNPNPNPNLRLETDEEYRLRVTKHYHTTLTKWLSARKEHAASVLGNMDKTIDGFADLYMRGLAHSLGFRQVHSIKGECESWIRQSFSFLCEKEEPTRHILKNDCVAPYFWIEPTTILPKYFIRTPAEMNGWGSLGRAGQAVQYPMFDSIDEIDHGDLKYTTWRLKFEGARKALWLHCYQFYENGEALKRWAWRNVDPNSLANIGGTASQNTPLQNGNDILDDNKWCSVSDWLWRRGQSKIPHPAELIHADKWVSLIVNTTEEVKAPGFSTTGSSYTWYKAIPNRDAIANTTVTVSCDRPCSIMAGPACIETNRVSRHRSALEKHYWKSNTLRPSIGVGQHKYIGGGLGNLNSRLGLASMRSEQVGEIRVLNTEIIRRSDIGALSNLVPTSRPTAVPNARSTEATSRAERIHINTPTPPPMPTIVPGIGDPALARDPAAVMNMAPADESPAVAGTAPTQ